jgi:hypothetical protein
VQTAHVLFWVAGEHFLLEQRSIEKFAECAWLPTCFTHLEKLRAGQGNFTQLVAETIYLGVEKNWLACSELTLLSFQSSHSIFQSSLFKTTKEFLVVLDNFRKIIVALGCVGLGEKSNLNFCCFEKRQFAQIFDRDRLQQISKQRTDRLEKAKLLHFGPKIIVINPPLPKKQRKKVRHSNQLLKSAKKVALSSKKRTAHLRAREHISSLVKLDLI